MTDTPTEGGGEGTWAKLRRRKVVQWGIAYAAGAWGLLQGLAYVTLTFHWPEQIQQLATVALLIGLPIVLVIAWYHGDRGQQRLSAPELTILTLLFLVGGGIFWLYQRGGDRPDTATQPAVEATPAAATDPRPSIAVLPFENRSRLEDDAFFVDGIHDDILTQLSKIGAMKVIARTSVEQFRDTKLTTKEIGEKLGVTKVLEGGVQRAGDRVRVTVQLVDATTDTHLWAESYDRELTAANIFAIQSEVAAAIAGALKASLTAAEQARGNAIPTQSLDAWRAYQLGMQRMATRNSVALTEAEDHFRKALALDPKFALAWTGLADTLALQIIYAGRPKDAALGDAETAVARALELDPNLAEAWASAGGIAYQRLQFDRAEQMLRRAIAFNANYATAHHWLSHVLGDLGRRNEWLAEAERAVVLDPLSAIINTRLGDARAGVGRFDDALVAYRQAIEIDPTMTAPYYATGHVHGYGLGRFDAAMAWYEKAASLDPDNPDLPAQVAVAHWELGDDAEAARWLARMLASGESSAGTYFAAALLYLNRGDEASARRHAQRAADLEPFNTFLIRDHDLRKGDYATARARYAKSFPHLFEKELPSFSDRDAFAAPDLALVLQHTGESERAKPLLDRSEAYFRTIPRLGFLGYGLSDVAIHALRGERALALAKLREAEEAGWRGRWRYSRDFDPNLDSIRDAPEFKAVFADIESDMAQQRAQLAARPKGAPLDVAPAQ